MTHITDSLVTTAPGMTQVISRSHKSLQMVIASVWDIDCDSQCVRFSVSGTQERVGLIDRGQRSSPDMFFCQCDTCIHTKLLMLGHKCVSVSYMGVAYLSVMTFCVSVFLFF